MAFIGKENESIERERHQDGEAERADLFRRCRDKTGKITYPQHPTMNQHQEPNRGDPDEDIQDNENDSDDHDMFF